MTDFEKVVKKTTVLLNTNRQEWEQRYGEYIVAMSKHQEKVGECFKKFHSVPTFAYYLSTTELKDKATVFTFSMRFLGQEVGKIKVSDQVYISTAGNDEGNKTYFDCTILLPKETLWDSDEARKFRSFFAKSDRLKGKSSEHTLESTLISEFSKKSSKEKLLCGIQPVTVTSSLRYPMPTPLKASSSEVEYAKQYGGGIDILARCNGNLTVIELKDEYNSSEPPEKAMKQAIAYATFFHSLLRSETANGQGWYHFFGYGSKLPKNLTINVVVAMPHNPNGIDDKSFANQVIEMGKEDKLVLHYMYLTLGKQKDQPEQYDFSQIVQIDTSIKPSKQQKTPVELTIHRGTDQIGGTVTEIKSGHDRIFIDFGSQLQGAKEITNLDIEGLTKGTADSTLLLTHYHGDHMGEIHRILSDVPVYLGEIATEISKTLCKTLIDANIPEKAEQKKKLEVLNRVEPYPLGKSFEVGNISITPYRVDHSAFDSYMFLIECEGKRILHTGDYRFHGFASEKMWETFREIGAEGIDYLITEGTTMSRECSPENTLSEEDYVEELKNIFAKHKKVAVLCSSTNIDHLASIQKALPPDKIILCDQYQKSILDIVSKYQQEQNLSEIYFFDDENIGVYKEDFTEKIKGKGYCAFIRTAKQPSFITDTEKNKEIHLVYSQWTGYLSDGTHTDEKIVALEKMFEGHMTKLHTSGHVYKEDLEKVIEILKPKKGIIPIHTENQQGFEEICGEYNLISLTDKDHFPLD